MPIVNRTKVVAKTTFNHVLYDQREGKGAMPYNQEIDARGYEVHMKPSVFLLLCVPITHFGTDDRETVDYLKQWVTDGKGIGSPFVDIVFPWDDEKGQPIFDTEQAKVYRHEGRHRAMALKELYGDKPMLVHIMFNSLRKQHIPKDVVEKLRHDGVKSQRSGGPLVKGPLWS